MLNITDKKQEEAIPSYLRLAFRPFFLMGSLYAIIAIALWVYMFQNGQFSSLQVPALWWHVHEMLFGFAMAIVIGFLLTAVQNWTGVPGTKHWRLLVLVTFWFLPRLLFWTQAPIALIASIESLLYVFVAFELGKRVVQTKKWRNLFFVPLLLVALLANLASYGALEGVLPFSSSAVWQAMLWWFALLISVMGGRVIPFFTEKRFQVEKSQPIFVLELIANGSLAALFVVSFFPELMNQIGSILMLAAGIAQIVRIARWKPFISLKEPLVWSLHLSYFCLPASLIIRALWQNAFAQHNALHLFAIGAIGGVILAMIARVTMGHTGREIYKGPRMGIAFASVVIAAVIRGLLVPVFPTHMMLLIDISAGLWILAFGLFVFNFAHMLLRPRVDGHPG
ncbi:NnrS family protein [Vibrio marisflavi]|uniref:NnrS protein n=1 Tax=Vibrio marisflavi CECT 7928 TaxID=634439 RepID=A0ABM9A6X0_9VIBR|nr:NnrS family protein [Vibrio marisflavi]CAH0541167.1 hypothetical protein VMF7928_03428 [Vibrio marisflavi CECT 7928]